MQRELDEHQDVLLGWMRGLGEVAAQRQRSAEVPKHILRRQRSWASTTRGGLGLGPSRKPWLYPERQR
jgi:hypothetical protein